MSVEVQILLMCLVFFLILSVIQSILIVVLARTLKEVPTVGHEDDDEEFDTHIASIIDQVLLERLPAYRQPTVWTSETKRTEYEPKTKDGKSQGAVKNGD